MPSVPDARRSASSHIVPQHWRGLRLLCRRAAFNVGNAYPLISGARKFEDFVSLSGASRGVPVRWSTAMSALPSPLQNQQGPNDAATDPSMEEIPASICRIIADDHFNADQSAPVALRAARRS